MTTFTWNGGTVGTWSTSANWTQGVLPGSGDDAVIDPQSNALYTITEDFSGTIASLTLGDANPLYAGTTLAFAGHADLAVTGAVYNAGVIDLSAGQTLSAGSILNDNVILMQGGVLAGAINDDGLIQGYGTINGTISGSGTIDASGGSLVLSGPIQTSDLAFQIEAGASIDLGTAGVSASTFTFMGTSGELRVPIDFAGIIANLNIGSSATIPTTRLDIEAALTGGTIFGKELKLYNGTSLIATEQLAHTYAVSTQVGIIAYGPHDTDVFLDSVAPCYAAGTRILTPDGEKNVEDLLEGDHVIVVTEAGQRTEPVKWIGHRRLDLTRHPRPDLAAPVRIRRDAIGSAQPHRDLIVSPDHCLFIDGKLIPAVMLVNGMTITQELGRPSVQYFHVQLDRHAILLAEGLQAESYLDTGNRATFANAGMAMLLHPEFRTNDSLRTWRNDACAPLAVDAETLQPIWQCYAERAEWLGYQPRRIETDVEPALSVVTGDQTIQPVSRDGDHYVFMLPAGTSRVTLTSRATRPVDIHPFLDDRRRLGVAIAAITLRSGDEFAVWPADGLPAGTGWHAAEKIDGRCWRWTDGAGELTFAPLTVASVMEIRLGGAATYRIEQAPERAAA